MRAVKWFIFLLIFGGLLRPLSLFAQSCDSTGNVMVFSNYDGGHLQIFINQNIPNLKIGVASYEPTRISIFGPYAANVSAVVYAGFNPLGGTGNFHCDPNIAITTVDLLPGANTTIKLLQLPPVTIQAIQQDTIFPGLTDLIGYNGGILGCASCSLSKGTGGINTYTQVLDYFTTYFGGKARFIKTQYGCWCDTLDCSVPPNCCQDLANLPLQITATSLTICNNQVVVLSAPEGYDAYDWSTGATTKNITVSIPGNYTVTVSNACGIQQASITVEACAVEDCKNGMDDDNDGLVDLNDPDCACNTALFLVNVVTAGGACDPYIVLNVNSIPGVSAFQWYFNNVAILDSTRNSLIIKNLPGNSGSYSVLAQNANGNCAVSAAQKINFIPAPVYNATVTPASCYGESSGVIKLNLPGGTQGITWEWFDAAGQTLGDQPMIEQLAAGTYALKLRYSGGCLLFDTFTVNNPLPLTLSATTTDATCSTKGLGKLLLGIEGGILPYSIQINKEMPVSQASFDLAPGLYKAQVEDAGGCIKTLDSLLILAPPELQLGLEGPKGLLAPGDTFTLTGISNRPIFQLNLDWTPNTPLDCSNCLEVHGSVFQSTVFTLSVVDQYGCSASASWLIKLDQNAQFYAPNAIRINENETNNSFEIFIGKGTDRVLSLQIFDRWGNLVHDGVDAWDGRSNNKICQEGVYTWFAEIKYLTGEVKRKTGSVTLIR